MPNTTPNRFSIEVSADRSTVWVNYKDGSCIGRFSKRFGIDLHTTVADQLEGKGQCLYCMHGPASREDWITFCERLRDHYNIDLDQSLLRF